MSSPFSSSVKIEARHPILCLRTFRVPRRMFDPLGEGRTFLKSRLVVSVETGLLPSETFPEGNRYSCVAFGFSAGILAISSGELRRTQLTQRLASCLRLGTSSRTSHYRQLSTTLTRRRYLRAFTDSEGHTKSSTKPKSLSRRKSESSFVRTNFLPSVRANCLFPRIFYVPISPEGLSGGLATLFCRCRMYFVSTYNICKSDF